MIQFTLGNKKRLDAVCHFTHANNSGQITTFVYVGLGTVSPRSFNMNDYDGMEPEKAVREFLISEYPNVQF